MFYTVTIQATMCLEAENENEAIDKACLEASFGTDFCDISLVSCQEEFDEDDEEVEE